MSLALKNWDLDVSHKIALFTDQVVELPNIAYEQCTIGTVCNIRFWCNTLYEIMFIDVMNKT